MIAKNKVTEITQIVFMIWISVLYVVRALQFYSVLESKRCLALNPATVDNTIKLSTLTA